MAHPGPNIRVLRQQLGLSLRALSDATGIERGNLSRMETGKVGYSHDGLERIAAVLHVSIGTLMADYETVEGAAFQMRRVPILTLDQLREWTGPESIEYENTQVFLHTDLSRTSRFSFAIRVSDSANAPALLPGDDAVFDANKQPIEGSFVIVQVNEKDFKIGRFRAGDSEVTTGESAYAVMPLDRLYRGVRSADGTDELRLRGTLIETRHYLP